MLSTLTSIYAPRLFSLLKDRKGVTSLEYAMLAVVVIAAVAGIGTLLTGDFSQAFQQIGDKLTAAQ